MGLIQLPKVITAVNELALKVQKLEEQVKALQEYNVIGNKQSQIIQRPQKND